MGWEKRTMRTRRQDEVCGSATDPTEWSWRRPGKDGRERAGKRRNQSNRASCHPHRPSTDQAKQCLSQRRVEGEPPG